MRIIFNKALLDFSAKYPETSGLLQTWRKLLETSSFASFADIKTAFNATDKVGDFYVFDIGGNKYRIIASIHFNRQMLLIRHVFTHKEHDKWKP
ncbi:MAG: type II toxin-antitoxin system HigB family toxin [Burkholderiaceae bacterium]